MQPSEVGQIERKTQNRVVELFRELYIVVHEMVHLLERNHNDRFISLMNKLMPSGYSIKKNYFIHMRILCI